jgi:hypothetical protein
METASRHPGMLDVAPMISVLCPRWAAIHHIKFGAVTTLMRRVPETVVQENRGKLLFWTSSQSYNTVVEK